MGDIGDENSDDNDQGNIILDIECDDSDDTMNDTAYLQSSSHIIIK